MKTIQHLLAAALLSAAFSTYAQTEPASQGPAPSAGDMPPSTSAVAPASPAAAASGVTATDSATATDPKMTPAALAARASTSRNYRLNKGRATPSAFSRVPGFKDGVTVRDGQVHVTQHGKTETLTTTDTATTFTHLLVNGDGTVKLNDGSTVKLDEGDHVSLTGKLTTKRMQFVQDSTAKAEYKERRIQAAKRNRGLRGVINNSF